MPEPRKKRPSKGGTAPLSPGGSAKKGRRGKKKKKKKASKSLGLMYQVLAGLTLVGVVAAIAFGGLYVYQSAEAQKRAAAAPPPSEVVARPKLPEPAQWLTGTPPKRPGLAVAMPDEIYLAEASDLKGAEGTQLTGLLERGVVTVFADGRFRPEAPLSRAEFVSWCYNAVMAQTVQGPDPFVAPKKPFPLPALSETPVYADVPAEHWASGLLASVEQTGLWAKPAPAPTEGASPAAPEAKSFRPDAPLSRADWLVIAATFATAKDTRAAALAAAPDEKQLALGYRKADYTDIEALKPEWRPYAALVFGDDARREWVLSTFERPTNPGPWHPEKAVTRGEAATWLARFYDQIGANSF